MELAERGSRSEQPPLLFETQETIILAAEKAHSQRAVFGAV